MNKLFTEKFTLRLDDVTITEVEAVEMASCVCVYGTMDDIHYGIVSYDHITKVANLLVDNDEIWKLGPDADRTERFKAITEAFMKALQTSDECGTCEMWGWNVTAFVKDDRCSITIRFDR